MQRILQISAVICISLSAIGCKGVQYPLAQNLAETQHATPPEDKAIVGTWRFARAGDHHILFPFIMKFDRHGIHTSGPTPNSLTQKANYSFDGSTITIGKGEEVVIMEHVSIKGNTMTIEADDGGEPILLTYHRIWLW